MCRRILSVALVLILALAVNAPVVKADDGSDEIGTLKAQVQELLKRIEKLEQSQANAKEELTKAKEAAAKAKEDVEKVKAQAPAAPRVDLEKIASKLKIKGRWAAGYYDSQEAGSFRSGSFEVPEGKIQFAFEPDEINKIIMRMSLNNATFTNLDYFYVDSKVSKFLNLSFEVNSRLGRMKIDFGEETWSNNPVESVLASNSAGNVSGSDEGLQLSGKIGKAHPLGWAASVTNSATGIGSDTTTHKALAGKLSYNIFDPLYISGSYYNSGRLEAGDTSEMSIAGLASTPTAAANWERQMWEVDLRYDFQKGKTLVPAYCDSKAFIRLAYGQVEDDIKDNAATGTPIERDFDYGFVEGTYNLTKKIYVAGRYSIVDLDSNATATLNSVTCSKYQRYSLGGGYRWTDNTILKVGYDWNDESGTGVSESRNNLLSAILASQF